MDSLAQGIAAVKAFVTDANLHNKCFKRLQQFESTTIEMGPTKHHTRPAYGS